MLFKPFGKQFLCNYPRLEQAVHAFLNFIVNVTIQGGNIEKFLVCNDIVRHVGELQMHVFTSYH